MQSRGRSTRKILRGLWREETIPLFAALLSLPLPEGRYPALALPPEQLRQRTFDTLVAWLLAEAEQHPVLTAWKDLHWADPSTLEVLGLVLEQSPTSRSDPSSRSRGPSART